MDELKLTENCVTQWRAIFSSILKREIIKKKKESDSKPENELILHPGARDFSNVWEKDAYQTNGLIFQVGISLEKSRHKINKRI